MSFIAVSVFVLVLGIGDVVAQEALAPCQPRATYLTAARLWWVPLTPLPTTATLKAYVLERTINQGAWQPLVELPGTATEYVDGRDSPLQPGTSYEWRLSIRWTLPTGEDVLSTVGPPGDPAPCLFIMRLPPPSALQAEPLMR